MGYNNLVLIGFFTEIYELAERVGRVINIVVDPSVSLRLNSSILRYSTDKDFLRANSNKNIFITPDLPKVRKKLYDLYSTAGHNVISLICPTSYISPTALIGDFACIQSSCNISSNVIIGIGVKVNCCANIMHDSTIGNFATIAPNAVLLGGVSIGDFSYIGANVTILPGVNVGMNVTVGAGSVVTKDIPDGFVVCGNPARKLR